MTVYNDVEPTACAWLRELMADGHISAGQVLEKRIEDIDATDVLGATRFHAFAGIGGWDYAMRLAGWPADVPVWTGSCPCQPFSCAGKRLATKDKRHLWPDFRRLIAECRPPTIFGEQVASKIGRVWLAGVRADLETLGYAVGAADLCAAGIGSPHIRQRLFWVAHSIRGGCDTRCASQSRQAIGPPQLEQRGDIGGVAYRAGSGSLPIAQPGVHCQEEGAGVRYGESERCGDAGGLANARHEQARRRSGSGEAESRRARGDVAGCGDVGGVEHSKGEQVGASGQPREQRDAGRWADSVPILCADGKYRRVPAQEGHVEPSLFPLAYGLPGRVGLLRGSGNAIVPQVAAEFVRAFMESVGIRGNQS